MTCAQCEQAVRSKRIKRPDDLSQVIRSAAAAVEAGLLRYEGIGVWGDPFRSIAHGGGWGDFVNNYFSCPSCSQWFNLHAETYHGSGGAFEAIEAPTEQFQKDLYPA